MTGTIFCDIDGVLFYYEADFSKSITYSSLDILPGAKEKLFEAHRKGYKIYLTTGRPESTRAITEKQLFNAGIIYDVLLMGVGVALRILINDKDPNKPEEDRALAYELERNKGLENIDLP